MRRGATAVLVAAVVWTSVGAASAVDDVVPAEVAATLGTTMPRAVLAGDSFYFVMTDRYANGDPSNDSGAEGFAGGLATGGFNPSDVGAFHGGDFKGMAANLARIKKLGFTAIWITPPFVQRATQGSSSAYHGYWIMDFTTIDPHLGTEADFAAFMQKAKSLGLKVYLDIVVNHTADLISYSDGTQFSSTPKDAYIPTGYANAKGPAFLNDLANYHNQGDVGDWNDPNQSKNGDFFGLDDIKTEKTAVVDGFAQVYGEWITKYGIDGFRIDTAKHVDDAFFSRWIPKVMAYAKAAGRTDFNMFGEVFDANALTVSSYVRNRALPSVLDFPMQKATVDFARGGSGRSLFKILGSDDYYNTGNNGSGFVTNAYSLPTFGGNHDMGRLALMLGSDASVARVRLATSLLFLLRGAPVVYYGDEVGMVGSGGDKAAREDMFPTKVMGWADEERIGAKPIGKGSSLTAAALKNPIATYITTLNGLRTKYAALRTGALLLRSNVGQVAAWSRIDPSERREFVLVSNSGTKAAKFKVATSSPSTAFKAVLGKATTAKSDARGSLTVTVPAATTLVMRAGALLPPTAAAPALTVNAVANYAVLDTLLTASTPSGSDPLTVTFIGRTCGTCEWKALGSDDAAPFRLALPKGAWGGGDYLDIAAVTRTSDGKTAAGPITHITHADVAID